MNSSREALLQPTLGREARPAAAPYSVQATFFTAFLAGPFAALAIVALNSFRLRRIARDLPALAACLLALVLIGWGLYSDAAAWPIHEWLDAHFGRSSQRLAFRLFALLIVGVGYLLHRREQRNADLLALRRPNGWVGGALCGAFGIAALIGFLMLVKGG